MACTAPGQDPPPRPMCLRSWETHQSRRLWPQPQVLASAVGWERLISNFLGTRSSLLGLSYNLYALAQGSAEFFLKGQMVNILDFESHMVSVTTTQCCSYSVKAATDST